MDAIRKIINSDKLISVVNIPKSLRDKQVELIILPVADRGREQPSTKKGFGILKKYAKPELIASEDGAWATAIREKYALR
jgi:hypothetical protein